MNTAASAREEAPKKRGVSRFFAFLNCCGGKELDASSDGAGENIKLAETSKSQAVRARLSTPRPDAAGVESNDSESSDAPGVVAGPAKDVEKIESVAQEQTHLGPRRDGGISTIDGVRDESRTHDPSLEPASEDGPKELHPGNSANHPPITLQAPTPIISQEALHAPSTDMTTELSGPSTSTDTNTSIPESPLPSTEDLPNGVPAQPAPILPPPPTNPPTSQQSFPTSSTQSIAPTDASSRAVSSEDPSRWLLPPIQPRFQGKKCLVLDLDETLVHSSFKILHQADFTIPVEIEGQYHNVYVIKRPGVDQFMKRVGELYEVVVFTASVSKGNYVKDLSQIGRDLKETIIIDNSPTSYIFHPQHAVPISSWFSDAHDNELLDLIPVLEDLASHQVRDVSLVLDVAI
ncbi:MAG: hypothetical protein M1829_002729 [Trizodia sp. TS-e1964]|nr:MAG: hypothetical protein M1829_002729 [Trizodia sp. TS-e1964]